MVKCMKGKVKLWDKNNSLWTALAITARRLRAQEAERLPILFTISTHRTQAWHVARPQEVVVE